MKTEDYLFLKFCKERDENSLKKLISLVNKWLYGAVYKIVADNDATDDIIQEVWIKLINSCSSFEPEKGSFNNYAFTVAKNVALKEIKKNISLRNKHKNINDFKNDGYADKSCPEFIYIFKERSVALLKAISSLDKSYQDVIYLFYYGGFSYSQISDMLSKPLGTVSSNLKRGKEELEKLLPDFIKNDYIMERNE